MAVTDLLTMLAQYGIAGIALYMMYTITYNHLTKIYEVLLRIEEKLD